ncbi:MAG TPA: hypothetical protein PLC52_10000 [Anaerolineales bacterium]|nr:hypothetical protein [Anaerolineales bacterium]HRQ93183.1 hypothetical protein [Anaerolineales bacterium]
MSRPTSPRDIELLSAHLDGQLTPGDAEALLARLEHEPELTAAFKQLQRTRSLLRRAPQRRVPRSFMLTAKMAGERARGGLGAWSGFNFASALAALALILVLVTDFSYNGMPTLGAGAAEPQEPMLMMAEAPVEESYSESNSADAANAVGAAESQLTEEAQGNAESDTRIMEDPLANQPVMKEAEAPTLAQWIAMNARTLEALLVSLAIIAGLLAWHHRRR